MFSILRSRSDTPYLAMGPEGAGTILFEKMRRKRKPEFHKAFNALAGMNVIRRGTVELGTGLRCPATSLHLIG
jgi:hypothetical protein